MRAIWATAVAAALVLAAHVPAWSKTPTHHIYGRVIHGIIIRPGHPKIYGIIIVHPGKGPIGIGPVTPVKNPIGVPPVTTAPTK